MLDELRGRAFLDGVRGRLAAYVEQAPTCLSASSAWPWNWTEPLTGSTSTPRGPASRTAAAEQLRVTGRFVRKLVSEHGSPYVKLDHYLRFDPAELETWIERPTRVTEANAGRSPRSALIRRPRP